VSAHLLCWTAGAAAGLVAGILVLRTRGAVTWATVLALGWAWEGVLLGAKWHFRLELYPLADALWVTPRELLEPGVRIPLGLLTGGVLAGLWCLLARAPWRETGDALAVAACVMMPIGRIGCLLDGCCMGSACGPWAPFCLRYPRGTDAYLAQVGTGLLRGSEPFSLPAHPLPIYFAASALAMLGVLLWLLRHQAAPGALLAAFLVLEPATKLLLEPLRATPRPPTLMVGIPATILVGTLLVLAATRVVRGRARRTDVAVCGTAAVRA
jgi:phosphatidylglycerol:prolipoprotein diacylglycerol transferase